MHCCNYGQYSGFPKRFDTVVLYIGVALPQQNQYRYQLLIINYEMDPRPYHFQYRRPRPYNPTFQSSHLYDSIYQLKHLNAPAPTPTPNPELSFEPVKQTSLKRVSSSELPTSKNIEIGDMTYRYDSRRESESNKSTSDNRSRVANYGFNLIRNTSMDQTQVYKRQEKNFNIISYYPKEFEPNLKKFPRLTLEDRLIEYEGQSTSPH